MLQQHTFHKRGGQEKQWFGFRVLAAGCLCMLIMLCSACAQSEKAAYMQHLTATIDPAREIPEEIIIAFDIDRKRMPAGAVASGNEQPPAN